MSKKLLRTFERFREKPDEKFKFLKYPGVSKYSYVISNHGRVFSYIREKELKFHYDKDGYKRIGIIRRLSNGKRSKSPIAIHRMVAFTFLKPKEGSTFVNHKDGVKTNNYYKNLEWTTPKENTDHAITHGLQFNSGPKAPGAIYTEETVRDICSCLEAGMDCISIYHKYFPDQSADMNKKFYMLIFSIKSGTRHRIISSEYDIPVFIDSSSKKKFKKEELVKIKSMMEAGYTSMEIAREFGAVNSRDKLAIRIMDKVRQLRKKANMK